MWNILAEKQRSLVTGEGLRRPLLFSIWFTLAVLSFFSHGCRPNDYYLIHPLSPQPGIIRESLIFDRGQLRVHWIAYSPSQKDALPAVLVHPDAGGVASDMEGICLDLARQGYFAAAVHYQRVENLEKENPLFSWKSPGDVKAAMQHLQGHPRVDPERIGLLGYSKGGMLSLLIASQDSSIKAVVAYYPLADFEEWLDLNRYSFPKSLWFRGVRSHVLKELQVPTWDEALKTLRLASPIYHAEQIQAPVLLIHGEKDRTAPLSQVQRLCRKMRDAGGNCELSVIPRAGHVFNFLNEEQGKEAWSKTMGFLNTYLKGKKVPHGN
jgi:dienelactone hydrolase